MKTHLVARHLRPGSFPGIVFRPDGGEGGDGNNGGTGTPAGDGNGQGGEDDKPVTLSQKQLEALIDKKLAQGRTQAEKKAQGDIDALKARLAQYEDADGKPKKPGEKPEGKTFTQEDLQKALADKDTAHKGELGKLQDQLKAMQANQKRAAIQSAAVKAKAIDPEAVALLVDGLVQADEAGNLVVVGKDGKTRINSNGEDLAVEDFIAEFLTARPYLKEGANTPGAGSHTSNSKTPPKAAEIKTDDDAKGALAAAFAGLTK